MRSLNLTMSAPVAAISRLDQIPRAIRVNVATTAMAAVKTIVNGNVTTIAQIRAAAITKSATTSVRAKLLTKSVRITVGKMLAHKNATKPRAEIRTNPDVPKHSGNLWPPRRRNVSLAQRIWQRVSASRNETAAPHPVRKRQLSVPRSLHNLANLRRQPQRPLS